MSSVIDIWVEKLFFLFIYTGHNNWKFDNAPVAHEIGVKSLLLGYIAEQLKFMLGLRKNDGRIWLTYFNKTYILMLFWIELRFFPNSWTHSLLFTLIIYWTIYVITFLVPFELVTLKTWIILQNHNNTLTCFPHVVFELSTHDIFYWLDICSSKYLRQYLTTIFSTHISTKNLKKLFPARYFNHPPASS